MPRSPATPTRNSCRMRLVEQIKAGKPSSGLQKSFQTLVNQAIFTMSVSSGAMLTIPVDLERSSCPSPATVQSATAVPAMRPCELIWMLSANTPCTQPNTDDDTISTVTLYDREDGSRHPSPEQQQQQPVDVVRPIPLRPLTIAQMSLWANSNNEVTC